MLPVKNKSISKKFFFFFALPNPDGSGETKNSRADETHAKFIAQHLNFMNSQIALCYFSKLCNAQTA